MTVTPEAVVWCPVCKVDKFVVYRVPTTNKDVFTHEAKPKDAVATRCQCGTVLERKNV